MPPRFAIGAVFSFTPLALGPDAAKPALLKFFFFSPHLIAATFFSSLDYNLDLSVVAQEETLLDPLSKHIQNLMVKSPLYLSPPPWSNSQSSLP